MHFELFAACVVRSFCLLRISEIEALARCDISVDTQGGRIYLPIQTRKSETDIFKGGILRSLVEIDSPLRPVATFQEWTQMDAQL